MFDVITIGSATIDVFVESDAANIVSVSTKEKDTEFMAFPYGSKLEIDGFSTCVGGGGVNTAVNFANLGFKTSAIFKIGHDFFAKAILKTFENSTLDKSSIIHCKEEKSGFSIVLISFQGDRTVLAHRGTNATICEAEINFEAIKNSKWLYIAPLNGDSTAVLDKIAKFAEENGVHMAINVGTTSIKQGASALHKVLETAEVLIMNKEEASMYTEISPRPDTKMEKFSDNVIHPDVATMLNELKCTSAKIVIITDGKNGAYAYDGKKYYFTPQYPAKVVSTLGAGDAFASTFVAALEKTDWDIEKSLAYATVNAASVVEQFSAQSGLLTFDEIQKRLETSLDYKVTVLDKV